MMARAQSYTIRPEQEFGLLGEIVIDWTKALRERRAERRAVQQLRGFSDYQLKDIGLSRAAIPYAVQTGRRYRR